MMRRCCDGYAGQARSVGCSILSLQLGPAVGDASKPPMCERVPELSSTSVAVDGAVTGRSRGLCWRLPCGGKGGSWSCSQRALEYIYVI